jgi:hypothetical protein
MVAKRRGVNATQELGRIKKFIARIIYLSRIALYERAAFNAAHHQQLFQR